MAVQLRSCALCDLSLGRFGSPIWFRPRMECWLSGTTFSLTNRRTLRNILSLPISAPPRYALHTLKSRAVYVHVYVHVCVCVCVCV